MEEETSQKVKAEVTAEPAPVRPLLSTVSLAWGAAAGLEMKAAMCQRISNFLTNPRPKEAKYLIVPLHFPLAVQRSNPWRLLLFTPASSARSSFSQLTSVCVGWCTLYHGLPPRKFPVVETLGKLPVE